MKKINVLKECYDFNRIIKNYKPYKYSNFIIYKENKDNSIYKFGISVGKKVGNAVTRNKIKRQIRSIISEKDYKNNFNCIIIVGKGVLEKNFMEIKDDLFDAFKTLNLFKED